MAAQRTDSLSVPLNWISTGFTLLNTQPFGPGVERVSYRLDNPLSNAAQQFIRIAVWRQPAGPPEFSYNVIDDQIFHGQGITLIDIDEDGDLDVIVALSLTDSVYLYLNGGDSNGGGTGSNWQTIKVAPDD